MLQLVPVEPRTLEAYLPIVGDSTIEEIRGLAAPLQGARVLHLNATAFGGGVAEMLQSLVPLTADLGLEVEWRVIYATHPFFQVTKAIHHGLQGRAGPLSREAQRIYKENSQLNAESFEGSYDFVVVHDPQPAAILAYVDRSLGKHWIWRCHLDTSRPSSEVLGFLRPFLEEYRTAIFTMPAFLPPTVHFSKVVFAPPAIDPLSPKNMPMPPDEARKIVSRFEIDPSRPLVTQISRFDPWKDPLGVIDAYRMVKVEIPNLQLALIGSMASDDPEGREYYERTIRRAGEDFDVVVKNNLDGVGSMEVNAFQRCSDVVIQKSLREGFGLAVAEALWKSRPVVASNVGGIGLQVLDDKTGYLVDGTLPCAERVYDLLRYSEIGRRFGEEGHERVREHFLLPRMLKDYLSLFSSLEAAPQDRPSRRGSSPRRGKDQGERVR